MKAGAIVTSCCASPFASVMIALSIFSSTLPTIFVDLTDVDSAKGSAFASAMCAPRAGHSLDYRAPRVVPSVSTTDHRVDFACVD